MREWLNKKVRLSVEIDGRTLYYTATIIDVSDTHITFIDKFDKTITKRISDVIEVEEAEV